MDAIELLTKDHRHVEELIAKFNGAEPEKRADVLADIIREVSIHAAIEEAYLYPVIRKDVPGGDRLVDESVREHQQVKEVLARLDSKLDKAHTKEVATQVGTLERDLEHHVHEEEDEVFPALADSVTKAELNEVGTEMRDAKATAPTRPHPNQPSATQMTSWANGVVDRVRDRAAGRG